ncbi:MAG TPA: NAD(P)/FAD-dependent oxidoreductase, partial [Chloroflexota bacterium]|nr:NAD(P)/FAD-dependent oxidoreductase [Chloroflexota bacterium]
QEKLAALAWDVSSRPFPWPPQSAADFVMLARAIRPQTTQALPYLWSTIGQMTPADDPLFRAFLDAQLLISAQTTSQDAHALYGSAALDLPRRGVNHVQGGIGALADTLVVWIRQQGGDVQFRQQVERIVVEKGRATAATTRKGQHLTADHIIANVTPWALRQLLAEAAPPALMQETKNRPPTWGAFTLYLGLDERHLPPDMATHHQVIVDHTQPLGEGNSVFISLSEPGDGRRAPEGMRTATLSTHTAVTPWTQLRQAESPAAYCERREEYMNRLLMAAERAIPGIRRAVRLSLPGTPMTFAFYTRRPSGMVGGFPQTSLFRARGPATGIPHLWLVGDSIFPGQSTAGVTLGGMRVATAVLQSSGNTRLRPATPGNGVYQHRG